MDNMVFGYARISTREQNLDRQAIRLRDHGIAERNIIVVGKESGKSQERPDYQALTTMTLYRGDTLVVTSHDRLSRSKADIQREMQRLKQEGVRLRIPDLPTTMMEFPPGQDQVFEMVNNVFIEGLGTIVQQEPSTENLAVSGIRSEGCGALSRQAF